MAADAGGSGRGLCCAFLLSFLPEVKTTNRFDLYAFPPLNRVFSMRLWLLQAPPSSCQSAGCHGNTPPPCTAAFCHQQRQDAATPEDPEFRLKFCFRVFVLGITGIFRSSADGRRFCTSWKVEARLVPTQFVSSLQNFGFTSCVSSL